MGKGNKKEEGGYTIKAATLLSNVESAGNVKMWLVNSEKEDDEAEEEQQDDEEEQQDDEENDDDNNEKNQKSRKSRKEQDDAQCYQAGYNGLNLNADDDGEGEGEDEEEQYSCVFSQPSWFQSDTSNCMPSFQDTSGSIAGSGNSNSKSSSSSHTSMAVIGGVIILAAIAGFAFVNMKGNKGENRRLVDEERGSAQNVLSSLKPELHWPSAATQ